MNEVTKQVCKELADKIGEIEGITYSEASPWYIFHYENKGVHIQFSLPNGDPE